MGNSHCSLSLRYLFDHRRQVQLRPGRQPRLDHGRRQTQPPDLLIDLGANLIVGRRVGAGQALSLIHI